MTVDGSTVLITGGTGSFGHKMTERLLAQDVGRVIVFSRDEAKQHEMRIAFGDERLDFMVGDIRETRGIERAMAGVDHVFHAAALKQVPSCEFFPMEAVMTNVIGSANVIQAAQDKGVRSVVCLSTDKAVMPVNAMGMTKALMEKVAQASIRGANVESETVVCTVRYGNVMYSRGSVIPLFVQQIRQGLPLTITDPEMTRFLLPLSVAVELVDYAFEHGESGNTFVRKAPAATIGDLATAVQRMFGVDEEINVIGVRHGEKLYETLASREELHTAVDEGEYWRLQMDGRGLNYEQYFSAGTDMAPSADYHSHNATRLNVDETVELLHQIPELVEEAKMWRASRS